MFINLILYLIFGALFVLSASTSQAERIQCNFKNGEKLKTIQLRDCILYDGSIEGGRISAKGMLAALFMAKKPATIRNMEVEGSIDFADGAARSTNPAQIRQLCDEYQHPMCQLDYGGNVHLFKDTQTGTLPTLWGPIRFEQVRFTDRVEVGEVYLHGDIVFESCEFAEGLYFDEGIYDGKVIIRSSRIGWLNLGLGVGTVSNSLFAMPIILDDIRTGSLYINSSVFVKPISIQRFQGGKISIRNSWLVGGLRIISSKSSGKFIISNSDAGGSVEIMDSEFTSIGAELDDFSIYNFKGNISINNVAIRGLVDVTAIFEGLRIKNSRFYGAIQVGGIHCKPFIVDGHFNRGFSFKGTLYKGGDLSQARVTGNLVFEGTSFGRILLNPASVTGAIKITKLRVSHLDDVVGVGGDAVKNVFGPGDPLPWNKERIFRREWFENNLKEVAIKCE